MLLAQCTVNSCIVSPAKSHIAVPVCQAYSSNFRSISVISISKYSVSSSS